MSLKTSILTQVVCEQTGINDLTTGTVKTELFRKANLLADGAGLNQANRCFGDIGSLDAALSTVIDLFDFSGAEDALGNEYALSKIKVLAIRNNALPTSDATLRIGGEGSAAAWKSLFNDDENAVLNIPAGGEILLRAPTAVGWPVADATNHLLKLANLSPTVVLPYEIIVVGAQ